MEAGESLDCLATPDDVCQAYEGLSDLELYRLHKAALIQLSGSDYSDPDEIINEAIIRTLKAANGGEGRRWPKNVPFIAYLIQVIRGLASDSRNSEYQSKTDWLEAMVPADATTEDVLGHLDHHHSDTLTNILEVELNTERQARAKADADLIEAHFSQDTQVTWIILGRKEDLSPGEIMEMGEMTRTQYDTAMRRFRRGIENIFSEKRPS